MSNDHHSPKYMFLERVLSAMEYQRAEQILLKEAQKQLHWEEETERWQPWRDKDDLTRCGG